MTRRQPITALGPRGSSSGSAGAKLVGLAALSAVGVLTLVQVGLARRRASPRQRRPVFGRRRERAEGGRLRKLESCTAAAAATGPVGAGRQRGGALPRFFREPGDVHAPDHLELDPRSPGFMACRAIGSASRGGAGGYLCDRGSGRCRRHRLPPLQHPAPARRLELAEPVLPAPVGAPAALVAGGPRSGWRPTGSRARRRSRPPRLVGLPAGRALAALTGLGIAGTVGEAGLLHFRGAFQNPFMFAPVTLPPVASVLLAKAAVAPRPSHRALADAGLARLTAVLGFAGVGFHALRRLARAMGGWRNWSQNVARRARRCRRRPSFPGARARRALRGTATASRARAGGDL